MTRGASSIRELMALPTANLVAEADRIRTERYGDGVWIRGLMEFTNHCACNCLYCGLRRENRKIGRYSLEENVLLDAARAAFDRGIRTFVLQGGEDPLWTTDRLCAIVRAIKEQTSGEAAVTLSCGIRSPGEYRALRDAGMDRYLMRFETSDRELHECLRDGVSLERRLRALRDLREAGVEVGSGFMVGLPGETEKTRRENLELCRDLELDMIGIGPFIPNPDTPLFAAAPGTIEETVRMTAIVRIILPDANIPATTAAGSLFAEGREAMLAAGANVLMPNITPLSVRMLYLLYPGKDTIRQDGVQELDEIAGHLRALGRTMRLDRGDSRSSARRRGVAETAAARM